MIKNSFPLNNFIEAVDVKTPKGIKPINYISECLSLGKDACYRRLRGEVEFTASEMFKIATSLSISIDELMGVNRKMSMMVETQFIKGHDFFKEYEATLKLTMKSLKEIRDLGHTKLYFVCDSLPMIIMGRLILTHKLRFYKWHYNSLTNSEKLSDFEVPQRTYDLIKETFELLSECNTEYIIDKNLFSGIIDLVIFFYSLGKISQKEVDELKEELLDLTDRIENYSKTGKNHKGKSLRIYSSHIPIETSIILLENEYRPQIIYNVYSANAIIASSDMKIFNTHKNWISYMKKSCSLISVTGDIERAQFFNLLRNNLNQLPH